MRRRLQLLPLLLCLLLCGCGQSKIQVVKEAGSASDHTTTVQEDRQEGSGTSEEGYQEKYYTNTESSVAEIIQAEDTPSVTKETDANEAQEAAVLEYAGCLYPEHTATNVAASSRDVNGKEYLFFAVTDDTDTLFCTIAYDKQKDVFYLYDGEVEQLIPIEYDEYGIRLIG